MANESKNRLVQDDAKFLRILKISYTNFKAFSRANLELRPITVLLGPNNAGKSSILAGLRILGQTAESFDNDVTLLLNGIFGDFGTFTDIVFKNNRYQSIGIELNVLIPVHPRYSLKNNTRSRIGIAYILKFRYKAKLQKIYLSDIEIKLDETCLLKANCAGNTEKFIVTYFDEKALKGKDKKTISSSLRLNHFLPRLQYIQDRKNQEKLQNVNWGSFCFAEILRKIEYVGAVRVAPARSFAYSGESRGRVGINGEHAVSLMSSDALKSKNRSKDILNKVISWMKRAEVARDIKLKPLSDRYYELYIKHFKTGEYENFADVGYGNSQVIPVLAAGYNCKRGGIFLVEQPELHLHPRAQGELGDFFKELYKASISSIIETHSEHLILRLQQYVASGEIKPNDIVFYYVSAKGKLKTVKQMTLGEAGQFLEDWPEGFFPERLEEAKRLARIRASNR